MLVSVLAVLCGLMLAGTRAVCPTACLPVVECPARQQLLCEIEAAKIAGTLDMRTIMFNPLFKTMFGSPAIVLRDIPSEIRLRGISHMEGVEELVREIGYFFINTLHSTCVVPVRDEIDSLIDGSVDDLLDIYHRILVRYSGPIPECPNRNQVQAVLQAGLTSGSLDAIGMIQNPVFRVAMFELPGRFETFLSLLNSGQLPNFLEMEHYMEEFKEDYIDTLNEGCYLLVRSDLEKVIELAFEQGVETYGAIMLQKGGSLPPGCPHRMTIRNYIVAARQTGTLNLANLIFASGLTEMAGIRLSLLTLQNGIRTGTVTTLDQILSTINTEHTNIMEVLHQCVLLALSDTEGKIDDAFDSYEAQAIQLFVNRRGSPNLATCGRRALLLNVLVSMETAGNVSVVSLITDARFTNEFSLVRESHNKLKTETATGVVTDRRTIFERVQEIGNSFRDVLTESCQIDIESNLEKLIEKFLDQEVETYCRLRR